jgi:BioD-like phosphotransacetylase family protein
MRQLYLAATGQNRGKTTAALGLLDGFVSRGLRTGFFKPVGQRTVIEDGVPADEDAVLMKETFGLPEPYGVMSPVHIPRGFTKAYIAGEVVEDLGAKLLAAHASYHDHEILLVEGTGHAGVGAVIGLSNAVVARMLGTPAVIISEGGVGRPIDEIVPQRVAIPGARRRGRRGDRQQGRHGCPAGDRHRPRARPRDARDPAARRAAGPADPVEPDPGDDPGGRPRRDDPSGPRPRPGDRRVAVGAMEAGHMLERVGPGTLVIVPGDREDVILTLTTAHFALRLQRANAAEAARIASIAAAATNEGAASIAGHEGAAVGLVLTGGYRPRQAVLDAIRESGIFATIVKEDTYVVASEVHDLLVKTHAADSDKIAEIKALVAEHLDIGRMLAVATEPTAA